MRRDILAQIPVRRQRDDGAMPAYRYTSRMRRGNRLDSRLVWVGSVVFAFRVGERATPNPIMAETATRSQKTTETAHTKRKSDRFSHTKRNPRWRRSAGPHKEESRTARWEAADMLGTYVKDLKAVTFTELIRTKQP